MVVPRIGPRSQFLQDFHLTPAFLLLDPGPPRLLLLHGEDLPCRLRSGLVLIFRERVPSSQKFTDHQFIAQIDRLLRKQSRTVQGKHLVASFAEKTQGSGRFLSRKPVCNTITPVQKPDRHHPSLRIAQPITLNGSDSWRRHSV